MKTQAIKLNLVLHNGSLRQIKSDELYNEIDDLFDSNGSLKKGCQSLYSKRELYQEIQRNVLNGKCCWEFIPYNGISLERIRQFSEDPFTLIDFIYGQMRP